MHRIALLLLCLPISALAEQTRYVSDELRITLRTGQGNSFQITELITSGTPLTVLEESETYSRVTTPKGNEGWVQNQYLTDQPVARDQLVRAQSELARLNSRLSTIQNQLDTTNEERAALDQAHNSLQDSYAKLENHAKKLEELAANPAQIEAKNRQLSSDLDRITVELEETVALRDKYKSDYYRQWFIAGGGVVGVSLLFGLLLGLTMTRLKKRRWGEL